MVMLVFFACSLTILDGVKTERSLIEIDVYIENAIKSN